MRNSRTGALAALQSARASGPRRPDSAASYGGLSYHSNATGSPTMTDQYSLVQKWRTQTLRPSTKGGGSPKSTIAKQLQKRRLNEIEKLKDARDERERRECRILLSRLHTKKEYLQIVRERLTDLQRQNVELKAEILSHESGVLNKVQSMIERCSRYAKPPPPLPPDGRLAYPPRPRVRAAPTCAALASRRPAAGDAACHILCGAASRSPPCGVPVATPGTRARSR